MAVFGLLTVRSDFTGGFEVREFSAERGGFLRAGPADSGVIVRNGPRIDLSIKYLQYNRCIFIKRCRRYADNERAKTATTMTTETPTTRIVC